MENNMPLCFEKVGGASFEENRIPDLLKVSMFNQFPFKGPYSGFNAGRILHTQRITPLKMAIDKGGPFDSAPKVKRSRKPRVI